LQASHRWKILGALLVIVVVFWTIETYPIWHGSLGHNTSSQSSTSSLTTPALATGVTFGVKVFDANTSLPIDGASVYLNGNFQGTTDSNGYVLVVTTYPPADQNYNVTAFGYQAMNGIWTIEPNMRDLVVVRLIPNLFPLGFQQGIPAEWITITKIQSVDYYLNLLESNGTQPYLPLGEELRSIPNLANATAVAEITYLALNASNPEVKEAFELMIRGGSPDPDDFVFAVPTYNTELQVLYWLACQNQFKRDDTLALAVALTSGLWATVGNSIVQHAVQKDANDLLAFFRETSGFQQSRGYFPLEKYPLEALISLVWTGNMSPTGTPPEGLVGLQSSLSLYEYRWQTVSVDTLRLMRNQLYSWLSGSVDAEVKDVEEFLYFSGSRQHWDYTCIEGGTPKINVNGTVVDACGIFNVDWQYQHFLATGQFIGGCADEASVANAWLMSIGVSSTIATVRWGTTGYSGHFHVTYYDPYEKVWKIYGEQLQIDIEYGSGQTPVDVFYIFVPPVNQHGYTEWRSTREHGLWMWQSKAWHTLYPTTISDLGSMFSSGVPTSEMKQWLLYS
jgi:hypothetical protein